MIVGYARVSTEQQKLDLQVQALKAAGCERIYTDFGKSGFRYDREGLNKAIKLLKPGGTLVVWRLDRLGRSLSGLVRLMQQLGDRKIHFRSLCENIDTTSSCGMLMFHMMAALAEFERSLIGERTRAGMAAAKAKGKVLGRPKMLSEEQILSAKISFDQNKSSTKDIADKYNVNIRTLQRYMMHSNIK